MDNLFAWTAIFITAMIALPFLVVAYVRRQQPERYSFSPKAEKRLFHFELFIGESMLGLWCYPMILHILVGDRSLVDVWNWQNTPAWALPADLAGGSVILAAIIAVVAIEMYKSYRAFKLRRAEQRTAADVAPQASVTPDNE